jgi:hypothetical protein
MNSPKSQSIGNESFLFMKSNGGKIEASPQNVLELVIIDICADLYAGRSQNWWHSIFVKLYVSQLPRIYRCKSKLSTAGRVGILFRSKNAGFYVVYSLLSKIVYGGSKIGIKIRMLEDSCWIRNGSSVLDR